MQQNPLQKRGTLFSVAISEIRGKKKTCEICKRDFSLLVKEHQCKRCKRAVCFNCSQSKAIIYKMKKITNEPHRICTVCKSESDFLQDFISKNKIMFGKDTISANWLQSLNNKQSYSDITEEYFSFLNDPQFELKFQQDTITYQKYKQLDMTLESFYGDLIDDFNYSIQEFLCKVIGQLDPTTIQTQIRNIMKAFLNKHPDVGFQNELVMVIIFFLCFSSEPVAFTIMSKFYDMIYPSQLFFKTVKQNGEIKQYVQLILQLLEASSPNVPQSVIQNIRQYLNTDFLRIVFQLSINVLTMDNTFLLIDNTIKANNFIEFVKGIVALIVMRIEEIKNFTDVSFEQIQVQLLRNIEYKKLQEELKKFEKLDAKTQEMILNFAHKEEQEKCAVDERFLQQKVHETPIYKELMSQFKLMATENENLKQQLKAQLSSQNQLAKEVDELKKQSIELKDVKVENFEFKNLLEDLKRQKEDSLLVNDGDGDLLKKQVKLQQLQIEQYKYESKARSDELQKFNAEYKLLQQEKIKQDTLVDNLLFENQTYQYEIDNKGRSKVGGSVSEKLKDPEKMSMELKRLQERLKEAEEKLELLQNEFSESRMNIIRNGRLQSESEYAYKSLEMQVEVLTSQLQKSKETWQKEKKTYEEKLSKGYRKMYESLEVVHNKNDELKLENETFLKKIDFFEKQQEEGKQLIKTLQDENQKLINENDHLNKTYKAPSKKGNNEDILSEFLYLANDENAQKAGQIKKLFARVKMVQQEIQFKNIDSQIKKEFITNLRSNMQKQKGQLAEVKEEVEKYRAQQQLLLEQEEGASKITKRQQEKRKSSALVETKANPVNGESEQLTEVQIPERKVTISEKGDCTIM